MGWFEKTNKDYIRAQMPLVGWMVEKGATWQAILDALGGAEDAPFYSNAQSFGRACRELLAEENPESMTDAKGVALLRSLGFRSISLSGSRNAPLAALLREEEERLRARANAAYAALADIPEYQRRIAEMTSCMADLMGQIAELRERLETATRRADAKTEENVALWRASLDQQARNQALREENRRLSEGVPRAAPAAPTLPEAAFSKTGF